MACTIDFRRLDEGLGGQKNKLKRRRPDDPQSVDSMDVDADAGIGGDVPPPSKRPAIPSLTDPDKPSFGRPTYDGIIAGKASGRKWKQPRTHRTSSIAVSHRHTSFEFRSKEKELKRAYKERMTELKEEICRNKEEKRKQREEREKRKKENILRSGTKMQKITNPNTLKKIAKSYCSRDWPKYLISLLIFSFRRRRMAAPTATAFERISRAGPFNKIAVGTREEVTHPNALKSALAEFISTFIFVFSGRGTIMAFDKLDLGPASIPASLVAAAVSHGFALFAAVSVSANISGGHVNPAVTFGLFIGGNITFFTGLLYWIAQLLGSVAACLILEFSLGLPTGSFGLTGINAWQALVLEIVLTFGLVYTVYATAVDPKKGSIGTVAPIAIGFIVGANILVGGVFDGAAMNPALSFGPALVSWSWAHQWVYWLGPLIGAAIAAIVYEVFYIEHGHGSGGHQPIPTNEVLI